MNLISYFFSDRLALAMSHSKQITQEQAPEIYRDTEELATKMGIPTPKIYIAPQPQPNAFATGRNPKNGVISLTEGLINSLSREEVKAVIAHELGHIKNRDILISTIAAIAASTITMIARSVMWFGSGSRDNRNSLGDLLLLILAPIIALIIQLAISRNREYEADEKAAETMETGLPLANALMKIDSTAHQSPMQINPALSSLYIANPLRLGGFQQLFSTHPSTESRVQRLKRFTI